MIRISRDEELTLVLLSQFLDEHRREVNTRYKKLLDAYMSDHGILHQTPKASYKPDNRIVVNFPKYIVDTMNGFFIGNPIKVTAEDKAVAKYVEYLDQYNDQDDNNAELSKICSIFGKGYEMYFTDEDAQYYYDTTDLTLTAEKKELTVTLARLPTYSGSCNHGKPEDMQAVGAAAIAHSMDELLCYIEKGF